MYFVSFIVALVLFIIAVCLFGWGLVKQYQGSERARNLLSSGFGFGLLAIIAAAIIFGFFNL